MERLTRYFCENDAGIDCAKCGRKDIGKCDTSADCASSCADRLAAIEDILGDTYDLDHLRELVEADKNGRCVVLPCTVGEKVYDISNGYITEKTVVSIPFLLSKSVNHLCLHAINKRDAATTIETADIGKTVFLTREAAEAALAKEAK